MARRGPRRAARELLGAGKTAAAIEELRRGEAIQPANIQFALDLDADLRKQGAAGEAEALYQRMVQGHEALCRDFPKSGTWHNDLAWLAASLGRDLDKALAHAQRAVELEPQSANILDTLAEVDFRRGNRAEALRLAKCCVEMEPEVEHFRKQLAASKRGRGRRVGPARRAPSPGTMYPWSWLRRRPTIPQLVGLRRIGPAFVARRVE